MRPEIESAEVLAYEKWEEGEEKEWKAIIRSAKRNENTVQARFIRAAELGAELGEDFSDLLAQLRAEVEQIRTNRQATEALFEKWKNRDRIKSFAEFNWRKSQEQPQKRPPRKPAQPRPPKTRWQ